MSLINFVKEYNIELLWEILLDEPFKNVPKEGLYNMRQHFNNELKLFYNTQLNDSKSNATINLMELNRSFLSKVVNNMPNKSQQQQQQQQPPQQQPQQLYKAEDLQADRMSQFETQLSQKRQEFESAITLKKPPVPTFSDSSKSEHIPINDMEALIAETLAQRNYDISQIQKSANGTNATNWLKPSETSIKAENLDKNETAIKYIKIGREQLPALTNEIVDINEQTFVQNQKKTNKKISWDDESPNGSTNIFSKLKIKQEVKSEIQLEILVQRIEYLENMMNKIVETLHM